MSEILSFQLSGMIADHRRDLGRVGKMFPDLDSFFFSDDRGYLRFRVFISRQNPGRLGNSKIPTC